VVSRDEQAFVGVALHRCGALAACRNSIYGRPAEKPPEHCPEFYEPRHSSLASAAIPKPFASGVSAYIAASGCVGTLSTDSAAIEQTQSEVPAFFVLRQDSFTAPR
jgi:hypothetical protein